MINILSAQYANAEQNAVILQTEQFGAIAIDLSIGGLNHPAGAITLAAWMRQGNQPADYVRPPKSEPSDKEVEAEAIRGKLTLADLVAARARLMARR